MCWVVKPSLADWFVDRQACWLADRQVSWQAVYRLDQAKGIWSGLREHDVITGVSLRRLGLGEGSLIYLVRVMYGAFRWWRFPRKFSIGDSSSVCT